MKIRQVFFVVNSNSWNTDGGYDEVIAKCYSEKAALELAYRAYSFMEDGNCQVIQGYEERS